MMELSSPGAVAFNIFGLPIYYYGITMAFAIVVGLLSACFIEKKYYNNNNISFDLAPALIITGFLGARIYYCLLNFDYYSEHFTEIFNLRQGGLSIHGMFLTCILFLIIYSKCKNKSIWRISAPFVVGISIAQAIGRWGNFFNSEAFGRPYDGLFKLYIAPQYRPDKFIDYNYFHPAFLWESLLDLFIFIVLLSIFKQTKGTKPKLVTSMYFLLYALVRIAIESIRIDSIVYVFNIPVATFVSVIILVISIYFILFSKETDMQSSN